MPTKQLLKQKQRSLTNMNSNHDATYSAPAMRISRKSDPSSKETVQSESEEEMEPMISRPLEGKSVEEGG